MAGCGQSAHKTTTHASASPRDTVCLSTAREAMAGFLHVAPQIIALASSTGNNGSPQCSFTTRADSRHVELTANDYTGPQPYFVLERTAIEASQQFASVREIAPPQAVSNLGIEADWFPATTQLMATDGIRLISVTVDWPGTTQGRRRALAEAVTRPYLMLSRQGSSRAHGYP